MGGGASKAVPARKRGDSDDGKQITKYSDAVRALGRDQTSDKILINDKSPIIRLDHSTQIKSLQISNGKDYSYSMKYCYCSQRGYYPNAMGKANQDSYLISEDLGGDSSCHIFGIFDGHGDKGDLCSFFIADNVTDYLVKVAAEAGGTSAFESASETLYKKAFHSLNNDLHKCPINDSLSGTTGVTVIVKGDALYVGNVGDSRAIIASDIDGKLTYSALSEDQTPYRKDERERLKKCGAKIMTLDQIEGNEAIHENWGVDTYDMIDESGNPPRVWDSTLEQPGCAFTRSFGDAVAETVGVHAEPEVLTWKLTPKDKFVVIASDGVFEFLSSQAVVDSIAKFSNPIDAAKHIVQESYRLWLTYDDRTDDITIIIINLEDFKQISHNVSSVKSATVAARKPIQDKPVRRVMTKAKRQVISENWNDDDKEEFNFASNATIKTPQEVERISSMVKTNFMFQSLSPAQKQQIYQVMKLKVVKQGELIINEGDVGEAMYIIDDGEFTVHKRDQEGVDQLVFTYTTVGAAFGELSLMYGKPRAASVRAKTDGKLWSIERRAFRAALMKKKTSDLLRVFKDIPVFSQVSYTKLQRLCEQSSEEIFTNAVIATPDVSAVHWIICVVLEGAIELTPNNSSEPQTRAKDTYIVSHEFGSNFKEFKAIGKTRCACIPSSVFLDLFGAEKMQVLRDSVVKEVKTAKRMSLVRSASIYSQTDKMKLKKVEDRDDYTIESVVISLGEFGYIGNFRHNSNPHVLFSIKMIAKAKADAARVDKGMADERKYLAALQDTSLFLPKIMSTFQDSKIAMLIYSDVFVCDLASAISNASLSTDEIKMYYAAGIYSGLTKLHSNGLMHRFLTPNSIYITNTGMPKLADIRYAKKMDGNKQFTICGDPLYFAPELVGSTGYDYSVDLWAYGTILFEMFEGFNPFGNVDTDETQVFKAITGCSSNNLKFTEKSPDALRQLVVGLLTIAYDARIGYASHSSIKRDPFFMSIDWDTLGKTQTFPLDISTSIDRPFHDDTLEPSTSTVYAQF